MKLPISFYRQENVLKLGKDLLGKFLFTKIDNKISAGMIIETESYGGIKDKACHAYNNLYTERTKVMYERGGVAYIYLCYGMHHLFNIVVNKKNIPEAILIRALKPFIGTDVMKERNPSKNFLNGPGSLCKSLQITKKLNGENLLGSKIWIEDRGVKIKDKNILKLKRIGIDYAKEDALLPWRFKIKKI